MRDDVATKGASGVIWDDIIRPDEKRHVWQYMKDRQLGALSPHQLYRNEDR